MYCWVDSSIGHSVVGGSLLDQKTETEAVAELALRVLRGEQANSIPISSPDFHVRQVDWRQLRRWGISEARVPAGTLVRFREPSAWDRYKVYILGAAALLLAQAALIAGLLVQADRRRQVEKRLSSSQAELRSGYERIRDLGKRLLGAQEEERARIARELHDDISQQMAMLSIDLQRLGRDGQDRRSDAERLATQALDRAEAVAKNLRDLSHRLHPAHLRLMGLVPALSGLQRELSTEDTAVTFSHENVPAALSHDLALCLFRIAQEALQNAVRHGRAKSVSVCLRGTLDGLVLTIDDDGVGFDVEAARGGLGLISMGERAEQVGGTLQIRSQPGGGTHLEVRVPFHAARAEARAV